MSEDTDQHDSQHGDEAPDAHHHDHAHGDGGHSDAAHAHEPPAMPEDLSAWKALDRAALIDRLRAITTDHGNIYSDNDGWLALLKKADSALYDQLIEGDTHYHRRFEGEKATVTDHQLRQALAFHAACQEKDRTVRFSPGLMGQGMQVLGTAVASLGHHYDDLGRMLKNWRMPGEREMLYRDHRKPKKGADSYDLQTALHIHPGESWQEIGSVLAVAAASAYLTDRMELPYPVAVAIKAAGSWPLYNSLVAGELEHALAHVKDGEYLQDMVKQSLITLMLGIGALQKDGAHTMIAAQSMAAVLKAIGNWQTNATEASLQAMESMISGLPKEAMVPHEDHDDTVAVENLEIHQQIKLTAGAQVPVDVKIVKIIGKDGRELTNTEADTYWSHGQTKQAVNRGEMLAQGTRLLDPEVTVIGEVQKTFKTSSLYREYEAQQNYKPTQQQSTARQIGHYWTFGTLAAALLTPIVHTIQKLWKKEGIDIGELLDKTASTATLASPCNILVSTAVESFYNRQMIEQGVIPTTKADLGKTKPTDIYAIDFTGTCSLGQQFADQQFFDATGNPVDAATSRKLFEETTLVGMKARGQHLMQKAMQRELLAHHDEASIAARLESMEAAEEIPSLGVAGKIDGKEVRIGRENFLGEEVPEAVKVRFKAQMEADKSLTFVRHGDHWGVVRFRDELRQEIIPTIRAMQQQGRQVHILTGDTNAEYIYAQAEKLGIPREQVHIGLRSEDKKQTIADWQKNHKTVTMIGDGRNDAAAMQQADCSYVLKDTGIQASYASADYIVPSIASVLPHQKQASRVHLLSGLTLGFSVLYTGLTTLAQTFGLTKLPVLGAAFAHEGVSAAIAGLHKKAADWLTSAARKETDELLGRKDQAIIAQTGGESREAPHRH